MKVKAAKIQVKTYDTPGGQSKPVLRAFDGDFSPMPLVVNLDGLSKIKG